MSDRLRFRIYDSDGSPTEGAFRTLAGAVKLATFIRDSEVRSETRTPESDLEMDQCPVVWKYPDEEKP